MDERAEEKLGRWVGLHGKVRGATRERERVKCKIGGSAWTEAPCPRPLEKGPFSCPLAPDRSPGCLSSSTLHSSPLSWEMKQKSAVVVLGHVWALGGQLKGMGLSSHMVRQGGACQYLSG